MNIHPVSFDRPLIHYSELLQSVGKSVHRTEEPLGFVKGKSELNFI